METGDEINQAILQMTRSLRRRGSLGEDKLEDARGTMGSLCSPT